jgi:methanogenic corrinoid protein MtbC1
VAPPASRAARAGPRLGVAVLRDRHVLGKRLVLSSLRAAGHEPEDLGHSFEPADLAQVARDRGLDILLVSTLMLRSALAVRLLVEALGHDGQRPLVIVGGAPFRIDPLLWHQVGADACGKSCTEAPALVARLAGYLP